MQHLRMRARSAIATMRQPTLNESGNMSADTKQNTITIDGQEIPFLVGQTIMDAALAAGVYIPHLCHRQGLTPHGS
ncbi:MAG: 2Fe-2S iron-sulfur cluster-binding protein [Candidatus Nitrotoga sp.]